MEPHTISQSQAPLSKQSLKELISLCKKYLQDEREETVCLADNDTYHYFKELALKKKTSAKGGTPQSNAASAPNRPAQIKELPPREPPRHTAVPQKETLCTSPEKLVIMKKSPEMGDLVEPRVAETGKATEPVAPGSNVAERASTSPKEEQKKSEHLNSQPVAMPPPKDIAHPSSRSAHALSFPLMPRPFSPSCLPPFGDVKEKVAKLAPQLTLKEELASDIKARKKNTAWKENYPQFAIVSFFQDQAQNQAQNLSFLQNVTAAIRARLCSCMLYEASSATIRELVVLAETGHLKAIVLAASTHTLSKANEFLLSLHTEQTTEADFSPLQIKGTLYNTQVFELVVTEEMQVKPDEKLALWKMLTRIASP